MFENESMYSFQIVTCVLTKWKYCNPWPGLVNPFVLLIRSSDVNHIYCQLKYGPAGIYFDPMILFRFDYFT